jgi:hypothetical protein
VARGSYFPSVLQRRRRAEHGLFAVGLVMFASVVHSPVSYLLAGIASAVAHGFGVAGAVVMAATGLAAVSPTLRRLD